MNILAIINQKGGCGKTITAVNLAAGLSKENHHVLLIDLDPQAHATFAVGAQPQFTIADALEETSQGRSFSPEKLYLPLGENFAFIGSSIGLASIEHKLSSHPDKLKILSYLIKRQLAKFDYIVIDCPPNLGLLTLNALVASNYALIPLMACDFSLHGMEILKNIMIMVKEFQGSSPTPFFALNQIDRRLRFTENFIIKAKERLQKQLLSTIIRTNTHLREAAAKGKHIFDYRPKSRGAEDFKNLSREIESIASRHSWHALFVKGKDLSDVYVVGDFNNWQKSDDYKLNRISNDIWSINIPLNKGTYRYKFVAKDKWFPDPYNRLTESDHFGGINSLLVAE